MHGVHGRRICGGGGLLLLQREGIDNPNDQEGSYSATGDRRGYRQPCGAAGQKDTYCPTPRIKCGAGIQGHDPVECESEYEHPNKTRKAGGMP